MKRYSREEIADYQKLAYDPHGGSLHEVLSRVLAEIIQQLLSDNEEMERALKFYADKGNWAEWVDQESKIQASDYSEVPCASGIYTILAGGKLARTTLAKIRGES